MYLVERMCMSVLIIAVPIINVAQNASLTDFVMQQ